MKSVRSHPTQNQKTFDPSACWDDASSLWDEPVDPSDLPLPADQDSRPRYHYTNIFALREKLKEGRLQPYLEDEMPYICAVVWTSTDSLWEPDCAVAASMGLGHEAMKHKFKIPGAVLDAARIVLEPSVVPWRYAEYWNWAGVPDPEIALRGTWSSQGFGNENDWWVTPIPIPASKWKSVEVWDSVRLEWIQLHQSTDRMLWELIKLLPPHLRGSRHDKRTSNELDLAAQSSHWVPTRMLGWDEFVNLAIEDDQENPIELARDHHARACLIRRQWFEADVLAHAGIAVTPVNRGLGGVRPDAAAWATRRPGLIDRYWLVDYPGGRYGIVLGQPSSQTFAIKLTGSYRKTSFARQAVANTLAFDVRRENDHEDGELIALFKPTAGLQVRPSVIIADSKGHVEVMTYGVVPGPARHFGSVTTRLPGPLVPSIAPSALIERIESGTM